MRAIDTLRTALMGILTEKGLAWPSKTVIEPPRDPRHGDLSVNAAMLLAKEAGVPPANWRSFLPASSLNAAPTCRRPKPPGRAFAM